jgi:caa(3)-type oxidase subunit IV
MADHPTPEAAHAEAHASKGTYWLIALILGIITLLEVAVFYVPLLHSVVVPILLVLSTAKFALVAMFFMHLKFDKPILTTLFAGGIVVATGIILAMMLLFGAIGPGAHM